MCFLQDRDSSSIAEETKCNLSKASMTMTPKRRGI